MIINKFYLWLDLITMFFKTFILPQDEVFDKIVLGKYKTPDFFEIVHLVLKF